MDADSIYILYNGSFVVSSLISFSWINDYINYIDYSEKNIIQYILKNKNLKLGELMKEIQKYQNNNKNANKDIENNELWEKINEKQTNDNLYKLKKDEEKLNSPENLFQLNLKKINYNDILGLEEVFEFKKRFCSCKCISEKAELKAIKITDLLKLISNLGEEELIYLLNIINERKQVLKSQILNGIKNLDKELIFNFDIRYENIIKSSDDKKEEEKTNMLLTAIRIKGYKTSIQDILDNNISLFPKDKNNSPSHILKKIKRKNKSSEQIMNKYIKQKGTINQFKFNKIKTSIRSENQRKSKKKIINNLINKFQNKILSNRNISENIRYKKILHKNSFNKTSYSKTNPFKIDKVKSFLVFKHVNHNKNVIYNSENINNNNNNKEKNNNLNNVNSYKSNDIGLSQSKSLPIFINKVELKKRNIRDTITTFDSINLPAFSLTNKNAEVKKNLLKSLKENKLSLKEGNGYKTFFNIFNADKNFYLGGEFQKKLKKQYKNLDSIYDENIIKKKMKIKNDFFL